MTKPTIFNIHQDRDADAKFELWQKGNPLGFYLNQRMNNHYILHRVDCWSLQGSNEPVELTICSLDREVLEQWLAEKQSDTPQYCKTCSPQTPLDDNLSFDFDE